MAEIVTARGDLPTDPLVSVITTFRDAEAYLEEAIASVLAQTLDRWELVLVDDGATDGSTAIARAYASRHPRAIRCVEHPGRANRGISASRNLGVAHSRGAYVAFLDADDVYATDKLSRQVAVLEARPDVDAVFSTTELWYSWTGAGRDVVRDLHLPAETTFEPGRLLLRLTFRAALTPATCGVLVRRAAFDRIGGFEESFRGMYEDQAFFYKLFLHCRTYMMAGVFDRYRQHPDSCCAAASRAGEYDVNGGPSPARGHFLRWLSAYLAAEKPARAALRCAVLLQLWLQRHPSVARRMYRLAIRARRTFGRVPARLAGVRTRDASPAGGHVSRL